MLTVPIHPCSTSGWPRPRVGVIGVLVLWFGSGVPALAVEVAGDGIPDGCQVVEGDIILPPDFSPLAGTHAFNLWPGGVVPYRFDDNVTSTNQSLMRAAMDEWEANAGVTFVPRTTESNFLHIRDSTGNSSFVGMVGGGQNVNIFNWNFKYIMAHELAHALGLWHEQSRTDRNGFVQINYQNIQEGFAHNFNIASGSGATGPYDFESIMHYGRCAFSIGGGGQSCSTATQTITVLPPNQALQNVIGQRNRLSDGDKEVMRFLYPAVSAPVVEFSDKNRYLSFAPNNGNFPVAIGVELITSAYFPQSVGFLGWVGEPDANGVARVVAERVERVWTESTVHLGDCEIVPEATYRLIAEAEGVQGTAQAPATVGTAARPWPKFWADCVGSFSGSWSGPNGLVNVDDVTAAIHRFQGVATAPPVTWVDVHPEVPNFLVNFADIQLIVLGFIGEPYPFSAPGLCP